MLAVVVLTDEDDRSFANADFDREDEESFVVSEAWLHPIERYVSGFRALREPSRFVFAVIAGVPPDLAGRVGSSDEAAAILADPRMQRTYNPDESFLVNPACVSEHGRASPARRLIRLAGELPGDAVVGSICADDYRPAVRLIADRLGEAIITTWCVDDL